MIAFLHWSATTVAAVTAAVFTGVLVVIGWLTYRQVRTLAAHRNPIKIGRPQTYGERYRPKSGVPLAVRTHLRNIAVYMFNHSDVEQKVRIDSGRSRIVWPRLTGTRISVAGRGFSIGPHEGGNLLLEVASSTGQWPADVPRPDEANAPRYERRYWLRLRGVTTSGHRIRFFGPVTLRELME